MAKKTKIAHTSSQPRCPICKARLVACIVYEEETDTYRRAWICDCPVESYVDIPPDEDLGYIGRVMGLDSEETSRLGKQDSFYLGSLYSLGLDREYLISHKGEMNYDD